MTVAEQKLRSPSLIKHQCITATRIDRTAPTTHDCLQTRARQCRPDEGGKRKALQFVQRRMIWDDDIRAAADRLFAPPVFAVDVRRHSACGKSGAAGPIVTTAQADDFGSVLLYLRLTAHFEGNCLAGP